MSEQGRQVNFGATDFPPLPAAASRAARPQARRAQPAQSLPPRRCARAREVVERLRSQKLLAIELQVGSAAESQVRGLRGCLGRALKVVSTELNAGRCHFLRELLQNADDNDYSSNVIPELRLELTADGLHVENNELGFLEEDVETICDVGASRKRWRKCRIGNKGIGFKSVFRYTSTPYICSGGFSFKFGGFPQQVDSDGEPALGIITPEWVEPEAYPVTRTPDFETGLFLPRSSQAEAWAQLDDELRKAIKPDLLLFLRRIRVLQLSDSRGVVRLERVSSDHDHTTIQISSSEPGAEQPCLQRQCFEVRHRELPTPPWLLECSGGKDVGQVACAFPLGDSGGLAPQPHLQVFSFLPICDSGLRFLLHGDFDVAAGRDDIMEASKWNDWIREGAADLLVDSIMAKINSGRWADASWLHAVPLPNEIRPVALRPFCQDVHERLRSRRCLPLASESPSHGLPSSTLCCGRQLLDVFGTDWIRAATGLDPISPCVDLASHAMILEHLGCTFEEESSAQKCLKFELKLKCVPLQWYAGLYAYLARQSWSIKAASTMRILPLRGGSRVAPSDGLVFIPFDESGHSDIEPPAEVKLLHAGVFSAVKEATEARIFLAHIGLRPALPSVVWAEVILPQYEPCSLPSLTEASSVQHLLYLQGQEWTLPENAFFQKCKSKVLLSARAHFCQVGTAPSISWLPPDRIYLDSEDLLNFFQRVEGSWFLCGAYRAAGVSETLLQSLGVHKAPRLIPSPPHKVPWHDRFLLETELQLNAVDLRKTFEHYVVDAWQFSEEVLVAASGPDGAAALLRLIDCAWDEIKERLVRLDVITFHCNIRIACSAHKRNNCGERSCAAIQRISPPPGCQWLNALAVLRGLQIETTSAGLRLVSECFARAPSLLEFFGDDLPYLPDEIHSPELNDALGVQSTLSVGAVIARLAQLSPARAATMPTTISMAAAAFHTIQRMYAFLALHSEEPTAASQMKQAFRTQALFACVHESSQFMDEAAEIMVTWSHACHTRWAGDRRLYTTLVFLQPSHDNSLRSFFVEAMGVAPRASAEDVLCEMRSMAHASSCPSTVDRSRARLLHVELARELARLPRTGRSSYAEEGRIRQLGKHPIFLTCAGTFTKADSNVFVPDDAELLEELRNAESNVSMRVLDVDADAAGALRFVASFFDMALLSEHSRRIVPPDCACHVVVHEAWSVRLREAAQFCAQLAYDAAPEVLDDERREATIERWCTLRCQLKCAVAADLSVELSIDNLGMPPRRLPCDAFGDASSNCVFVDNSFSEASGAWLDIAAETGRLFSDGLPAERKDTFQQRVQLVLSAPNVAGMRRLFARGTLRTVRPLPSDVVERLVKAVAAVNLAATQQVETGGWQHDAEGPGMRFPQSTIAMDGNCQSHDDWDVNSTRWWNATSQGSVNEGALGYETTLHASDWRDYWMHGANDASAAMSMRRTGASPDQHLDDEHEGYEMPKLLARLLDAAAAGDEACAQAASEWHYQFHESSQVWYEGSITSHDPLELHTSALSQSAGYAARTGRQPQSDDTLRTSIQMARQLHWRSSVEAAVQVLSDIYSENRGPAVLQGRAERLLSETRMIVPAGDLRYIHHRISPKFGSGCHRGADVRTLVDALTSGSVTAADLRMRGVAFRGRIHVLNNRRAFALKQYERQELSPRGEVCLVPILVYSLCPVTAKFMLGYSTTSEGIDVEIGF